MTARCPKPVIFTSSGTHTVARTVHATDGGKASVRVSGIRIDRIPPTITLRGVRPRHTYAHKRHVWCVAHDSLSQAASCSVTQWVPKVHGKKHRKLVRYRLRAVDRAGNVRTVNGSYWIRR